MPALTSLTYHHHKTPYETHMLTHTHSLIHPPHPQVKTTGAPVHSSQIPISSSQLYSRFTILAEDWEKTEAKLVCSRIKEWWGGFPPCLYRRPEQCLKHKITRHHPEFKFPFNPYM